MKSFTDIAKHILINFAPESENQITQQKLPEKKILPEPDATESIYSKAEESYSEPIDENRKNVNFPNTAKPTPVEFEDDLGVFKRSINKMEKDEAKDEALVKTFAKGDEIATKHQLAFKQAQKDFKTDQELFNKHVRFLNSYAKLVEFVKSLPNDAERKMPIEFLQVGQVYGEDKYPVPETYTACLQLAPAGKSFIKDRASKSTQALAALNAWVISEWECLYKRYKKIENRIEEIVKEIDRKKLMPDQPEHKLLDNEKSQLEKWQYELKKVLKKVKDVANHITTVNHLRSAEKILDMFSAIETLQEFQTLKLGQTYSKIDDYFTALHTTKTDAQTTTLSDLKALIRQAEAILGTDEQRKKCTKLYNFDVVWFEYKGLKELGSKLDSTRRCVKSLEKKNIDDKEKKKLTETAESYITELNKTLIPNAQTDLQKLRLANKDVIRMHNSDAFERYYYSMHYYELQRCSNKYIEIESNDLREEPSYKEKVQCADDTAYAEIYQMRTYEDLAYTIEFVNQEDWYLISAHTAKHVSDHISKKIKALSGKFEKITLPTSSNFGLQHEVNKIKSEIDQLVKNDQENVFPCILYVKNLKNLSPPSAYLLKQINSKQQNKTQDQQNLEIQQQSKKKQEQEKHLEILKQLENVFVTIENLDKKVDALITKVESTHQLEFTQRKEDQEKRKTELANELTDAVAKLTIKLKEAETILKSGQPSRNTVSAFFDKSTYADLKKLAAVVDEVNKHIKLLQEKSPGKTAEEKRNLISKTNDYMNRLTTLLPLAQNALDLSAHVTQSKPNEMPEQIQERLTLYDDEEEQVEEQDNEITMRDITKINVGSEKQFIHNVEQYKKQSNTSQKAALSEWRNEKKQIERKLKEYKKTLAELNSMCDIMHLKKQVMELDNELHKKVQSLDAASILKYTAELKQKCDALSQQITMLRANYQTWDSEHQYDMDEKQNIKGLQEQYELEMQVLNKSENEPGLKQPLGGPNPLMFFKGGAKPAYGPNKDKDSIVVADELATVEREGPRVSFNTKTNTFE